MIQPGDYVLFNVQGKVWAGDREVVDSYTDRQPQGLPLRSPSALPAWRRLAGQRVGSRVLMVVPPRDGFGPRGDPQANVMGTDALVFVFDLLGAMREKAHALLVLPPGLGYGTGRGPARCGRARHPDLRGRHPRRAMTARPAGPAASSQVRRQRAAERGNETFTGAAGADGNRALGHARRALPLDRPANLAGIFSREFAYL